MSTEVSYKPLQWIGYLHKKVFTESIVHLGGSL
jgi:hypothetical protein